MAVPKVLLLCQIIGYTTGFISSIFIIAAMGRNLYTFDSCCLLFAQVQWYTYGVPDMICGSIGYCSYIIVMGVLMCVVCTVQTFRCLKLMYSETDTSFLMAFCETLGTMVLSALNMYAAVMVTLGFMDWCNNMTNRYSTCQDADGETMDILRDKSTIKTTDFYIDINIVLVFTWAAFSICVGIGVCSMVKVCFLHRLANIPVSLRGERQPLLNGSRSNTPPYNTLE